MIGPKTRLGCAVGLSLLASPVAADEVLIRCQFEGTDDQAEYVLNRNLMEFYSAEPDRGGDRIAIAWWNEETIGWSIIDEEDEIIFSTIFYLDMMEMVSTRIHDREVLTVRRSCTRPI